MSRLDGACGNMNVSASAGMRVAAFQRRSEMDIQTEQIDSSEMSEYTEEMVEENLHGNDAGRAFARKHIIEKMNLFIDEYRRNGYSENFVAGFVDGINDVTGGVIYLAPDDEETADLLDNPPDSD